VDLGAVLPGWASGCVGCRRRENIVRITRFKLEDRSAIKAFERLLSMKACLIGYFTLKSLVGRLNLERVLRLT